MIVHQTPGLLDPRAFTIMGVSSKPNSSSPIGYFGTGLKYAMAVLARHKCPVTVWIGTEPHVFYAETMSFREKEFLQMRMKRQRGVTSRWMSTELPFTTELGKNWELWMAFRELHSNTLDEGGETQDVYAAEGLAGYTRIVVEGEAYAQCYANMHEVFLPRKGEPLYKSASAEIWPGESKYVYFRGLRVGQLPRKSSFTLNITGWCPLTEDRTMQFPHLSEAYFAQLVLGLSDKEFIRRVLRADESLWESQVNWDSQRENYHVSPEFIEMARLYGNKNTCVIVREAREAGEAKDRPPVDWKQEVITALRDPDDLALAKVIRQHSGRLTGLLQHLIDKGTLS